MRPYANMLAGEDKPAGPLSLDVAAAEKVVVNVFSYCSTVIP